MEQSKKSIFGRISIDSMYKYLFYFGLILCFSFCKKKNTVDQPAKDEEIIKNYIVENKLNAKATGSGLYYVITAQGTGARPNLSSTVTVVYKGYLTDGTVFDQSNSAGASFGLSGVIKGWQEGIPYFNKGGTGKLLIPSALGYGSQAQAKIPANSVIIFDINLTEVK